ncbi:MAG: hypothetical protein JW891_17655, partial [Candidatus Lokiarchaeota archaeon]|nr:hypothetical protein [Candidatus Lokiarchaeota archaeon]
MPSKPNEMPRTTVSLDIFNETIIGMMAEKRKKSKSEVIRFIVDKWVETNSEILKEQYGIDTEHVSKELEIDNLDVYIEEKIKVLSEFSQTFDSIDINLLAESLDMSRKRLVDLIFKHQKKLDVRLK